MRSRHLDASSKDLLKRLLASDRAKRLGALKNGADDVKRHRWFKPLDWDAAARRRLRPPIIPSVAHEGDVKNYDDYEEVDWANMPKVGDRERKLFEDF